MKLILAQGNPGTQYLRTRHNIGFMALDVFAAKHAAVFNAKPKFQADIAEISLRGEKVLLVKPTTFYNETGTTARALVDFYKLHPASDLLVVHDELALPLGVVRTRQKGSDAGNNGIKSLNTHLGQDYARIRIGINTSLRTQAQDADFVLGTFSQEESAVLPEIFTHVDFFVEQFLEGTLEPTSRVTYTKEAN